MGAKGKSDRSVGAEYHRWLVAVTCTLLNLKKALFILKTFFKRYTCKSYNISSVFVTLSILIPDLKFLIYFYNQRLGIYGYYHSKGYLSTVLHYNLIFWETYSNLFLHDYLF